MSHLIQTKNGGKTQRNGGKICRNKRYKRFLLHVYLSRLTDSISDFKPSVHVYFQGPKENLSGRAQRTQRLWRNVISVSMLILPFFLQWLQQIWLPQIVVHMPWKGLCKCICQVPLALNVFQLYNSCSYCLSNTVVSYCVVLFLQIRRRQRTASNHWLIITK